jgi:cation-transporting ATPase E
VTISIATIVFTQPFPFLNRHLTIVTALTIGTPAFFLALLPNKQRFRPGFFRRVLKFAVPAGLINAISAYVTYGYVLHLDYGVEVSRSSAVVTLFVVAWWVLVQVARPINAIRGAIVGVMLVGFLGVLYIPWLARMFELSWKPDAPGLIALGVGVLGAGAVSVVHAFAGHGKPEDEPAPALPDRAAAGVSTTGDGG